MENRTEAETKTKTKTVAVIFGGQSSEHEISCMSAVNVIAHIDRDCYDIVLIGITTEGEWLLADSTESVSDGSWRESGVRVIFSPEAVTGGFYLMRDGALHSIIRPAVVFPVLHGLYGEDGTIQGLLELAHIPYVGCGVFASAAAMDKFFTKTLVGAIGIRQAAYVGIWRDELSDMERVIARIEQKLSYPVFVKPSRAGSSKGVSKAADRAGLTAALLEAARHDWKILVEETITGRELECAVLERGAGNIQASGVGEILAAADFYDFDAKYNDETSKTDVTPRLPETVREEIRTDACAIFRAVGGSGLARVDFFLDEKGVVFNEINTLPGFTAISMYPMLWEQEGVDKDMLIRILLEDALQTSR